MNDTYYLYKKGYTAHSVGAGNDFLESCTLRTLSPNPFKYKLDIEKTDLKQYLSRLYFWIVTAGKYTIYFLCNGDDVVHSSYVVPKCVKFPFMKKGDMEIGPCVTYPDYRRRGSYCYMLNHITMQENYANAEFYMIVRSTNGPSVNGIEKAGFVRIGVIYKTRILKRYILEAENG